MLTSSSSSSSSQLWNGIQNNSKYYQIALNMSNRSVCTKGCFYSTSICFWLFGSFTWGHRAQMTIINSMSTQKLWRGSQCTPPSLTVKGQQAPREPPHRHVWGGSIVSFPLSITTTRRTYLTNHDLYLDYMWTCALFAANSYSMIKNHDDMHRKQRRISGPCDSCDPHHSPVMHPLEVQRP